jgi:hypothetical protein
MALKNRPDRFDPPRPLLQAIEMPPDPESANHISNILFLNVLRLETMNG